MKSLALTVESSQSSIESEAISCVPAMQQIILLLGSDLDVKANLTLHGASQYFSPPPKVAVEGGDKDKEPFQAAEASDCTPRAHGELSATGRETRRMAHAAVFDRFGRKRWGQGYEQESHLFDMALALNPSSRGLGYVDNLSQTKSVVGLVKEKVWAQLQAMVEEVVVVERATGKSEEAKGRKAERAREREDERSQKRLKLTPTQKTRREEMARSGIFDEAIDDSETDYDDDDIGLSPREEAANVISTWRTAKVSARACVWCVCVFFLTLSVC